MTVTLGELTLEEAAKEAVANWHNFDCFVWNRRSEVADAVIQAMANHTRSKVLSAPRLVVADNAAGTLASVQEVPYTSVNASTTVATTSFAGFAEAGTTIQVTPRTTLPRTSLRK